MNNDITKADDPELVGAYLDIDRELRLRRSAIGCLLVLILMPMGSMVDFVVYREHLWDFFKIRLLIDAIILVVWRLHYTKFGERRIRELGIFWLVLLNMSFCWMIYHTDGPDSPYYAAINLMVLTAAVLLPWTVWETLFASAISLVVYIITCVAHSSFSGVIAKGDIMFNNVYFLLLTGILCTTSSHFTARSRFQDFLLRHELDIQNRKLQDVDRLKTQFFSNVSHELRTPLTLILTPVEDLLRRSEELPDKVHDSMLVLQRNALRLLKLINEMLDVIRLEDDSMKIHRKPINFSDFVPGVVNSIRHLGTAKGLTVHAEQPGGDIVASGDPNRLEKVLLNLLSNAIKFTPSGGSVTVTIAEDDNYAVVKVCDTGIGISADELPRVFERFHQADGSSTRQYQGVGIGLSLARDLVAKHDGSLDATSEPGRGTTFTMQIPLWCEDAAVEGTAVQVDAMVAIEEPQNEPFAAAFKSADRVMIPVAASETVAAVGSGDKSVLVVDDEPDMLRFVVSTLAEEYRVYQAVNGEDGLAMAREHRPDLILLDWMLPGIDGLEACKQLRNDESFNDVKIVLLTARVDEPSKIQALESGADDFLTKPFSTIELQTRIAGLLRVADLQVDLRARNIEIQDTLDKLRQAESQLVQSEKMAAVGTLAAGILHEVNNPLNYTLAALQLAKLSIPDDDEDLKDTFKDIDDGLVRIRDIVSDLRTFAYPEHDSENASFELVPTIDAALRMVAHELDGITIDRSDLDYMVYGSSTQITHVLMNLLVNSATAVEGREEPKIEIRGHRDNGKLSISVWDNGVGIKEDNLEKIFEPFYTTQEVGSGMGLGLSICHTIVRNHGGDMQVESNEGEWTSINFDLRPVA